VTSTAQPARSTQPAQPDKLRRPVPHALAERLGETDALDAPAQRVAGVMRKVLGPGALKDLLSGTFLGHPLHPLLTDIPIGAWTSAVILDVVGGRDSEKAADLLVGTGIAAALPTAASGYSDWSDTVNSNKSARRIGLVHAAANVTALCLYSASLLARRRGSRGAGRALALTGMGALGVGGHLGGHLSYAEAVGVDQTAFDALPEEWTPAIADAALGEGETRCVELGGVPVLIARDGGRVLAIHARCSHRGGPLHEGEISNGCVTCPWHGSRFSLEDGSVRRGPAAMPQPAFETRVEAGSIEIRALR
jgi:nitrite reductase/ring-hydroxylating ferredoxin subunit/uncharacterized membrane protein